MTDGSVVVVEHTSPVVVVTTAAPAAVVEHDPVDVVVIVQPPTTVATVPQIEVVVIDPRIPGRPGRPGRDGTGGGGGSDTVSFPCTAGETLSGHRAVTPDVTGAVLYADPATIGNQPVWITTGAADEGDPVTVVALGDVTESSWAWTQGNVYLAAFGVLTQTEPTTGALVVVGAATAPHVLFVDRQPTLDL